MGWNISIAGNWVRNNQRKPVATNYITEKTKTEPVGFQAIFPLMLENGMSHLNTLKIL